MAFAVLCKSCQARFLLNDDLLRRKVAGRVVTVRCRQCHAPIEVDASDLTPQQVEAPKKPEPPGPPPPSPLKVMSAKPAPSPPRPMKSATLIGIGGPPRPGGATELVALSPGFLNMSTPAPVGPRGFPEPPPPPQTTEELNSDDWEVTETPAIAKVEAEAAPESVDDFVEELPPSLPPPSSEEELPSSTGTPSLKSLTHHEEHGARPQVEDFFANMSASMGGAVTSNTGAPTIDVSTLSGGAGARQASEIELSAFDVPLTGKQTLPLFGLDHEASPALRPPPVQAAPEPRPPGALHPSPPERATSEPASVRQRRNVVAPATTSVPPPAPATRRSRLGVPVLLLLAAAAGFLIWKRSSVATSDAAAHAEAPTPSAPAPAAVTTAPLATAEPAPEPASSAVAAGDDLTFERTPAKASTKVGSGEGRAPASTKPSEEPAGSSSPVVPGEPSVALAKEEPKPATPTPPPPADESEPAGPFDRAAAAAALTSGATVASGCRKEGDPSGVASVVITFAPSGRVTSANISGPPFAGTATGGCIASALRKARVPPFEGDRVTVSKTIVIQ